MCHEPSKQVYADGGIYHNNPIMIADQERKLLGPQLADEHPDIVMSIGTSYNPDSARRIDMGRTSTLNLGALNQVKSLLGILMDHLALTLDSEKTWDSFMEILSPPSSLRHRYMRLNPKLPEDPPALDQVDKLSHLQGIARTVMMEDGKIK